MGAGLDVVPRPTFLWRSGEVGADDEQAAKSAALSAMGQLAYLRSINGDRFDAALASVSEQISAVNPDRAKLFDQLRELITAWQPRSK